MLNQFESLLAEAVGISDEAARFEFVERACGGDDQRKAELRAAIADYFAADSLLEAPLNLPRGSNDNERTSIHEIPDPEQIGPYRIRERIGEGGMGVVFVADQTEPIRRRVALKVIKPGLDAQEFTSRFERERQALALMDHPGIAKILDGGTTEEGRPYLVMELVRGVAVTEYCDSRELDTKARLACFLKICLAVEHAHQKGVIHRDLKPSNILVTRHDNEAVPKIIDFGVAKATSQLLEDNTVYTAFTQLVGTPIYMSPEQVELNNLDVDTRSDVYALGVVLYELLTGKTPFARDLLKEATFDEFRRIIREEEPPRPSSRLGTAVANNDSTLKHARGVDLRRVAESMKGELDWIVMKTLEKDRGRRYQSARELADDVKRFLNGEAVNACPPSVAYKLRKQVAKNRGLLAAVAAVLVTATTGAVTSTWYAIDAGHRAQQATEAKESAEAATKRAEELSSEAQMAALMATDAKRREADERIRAEAAVYRADMQLAASQISRGLMSDATKTLLRHEKIGDERNNWEWHYLLDESTRQTVTVSSNEPIEAVDWHVENNWIASVSGPWCAIHDGVTGELIKQWRRGPARLASVAWSPDGKRLAWGSVSQEGLVRIWDQEDDHLVELPTNGNSVWSLAWSVKGDRLVAGTIQPGGRAEASKPNAEAENNLLLFALQDKTWEQVGRWSFPNHVSDLAWHPIENQVLVTIDTQELHLVDVETGAVELVHDPDDTQLENVHKACWLGIDRIAIGLSSGRLSVIDPVDGKLLNSVQAHAGQISHVQSMNGGEMLVTSAITGEVKVWNAIDLQLIERIQAHDGAANGAASSPSGDLIASVGSDGFLNVWPIPTRNRETELPIVKSNPKSRMLWTANHLLSIGSSNGRIHELDPRTSSIVVTHESNHSSKNSLLLNNDWSLQLSPESARLSKIAEPDEWLDLPAFTNLWWQIALSPRDQQLVYFLGRDVSPVYRDLNDQQGSFVPLATESPVSRMHAFAWDPTETCIAGVGTGNQGYRGEWGGGAWLHLYRPRSEATGAGDTYRHLLIDSEGEGSALAWSPDGLEIVVATNRGMIALVDAIDLDSRWVRRIHRSRVTSIAWHPTEPRVASAGDENHVLVWNSENGDVLLSLSTSERIRDLTFSPDGTMLVAMSESGRLQVWDSLRGQQIASSAVFQTRRFNHSAAERKVAIETEDWYRALRAFEVTSQSTDNKNFKIQAGFYSAILAAFLEKGDTYLRQSELALKSYHPQAAEPARYFAVWPSALAYHHEMNYAPIIELAEELVEVQPDIRRSYNAYGGVLLRSGALKEAREALKKALELPDETGTPKSYTLYLLAITEFRLGNADVARDRLIQANESAEATLNNDVTGWWRRLTIEVLRREAQRLIGPRN